VRCLAKVHGFSIVQLNATISPLYGGYWDHPHRSHRFSGRPSHLWHQARRSPLGRRHGRRQQKRRQRAPQPAERLGQKTTPSATGARGESTRYTRHLLDWGAGGGSLRSSAPLSWDVVGSAAGRHPIVLSRSFTPTCSALGLTPKQGVATSRPSETRERRLPQHLALGAVHGASQAFQRHDRRRASLVALAAMGTIKHAAPHRSHNYQLGSKDIPCQLLAWREVLWAGFPNHPP
jgi:hypothetical protein